MVGFALVCRFLLFADGIRSTETPYEFRFEIEVISELPFYKLPYVDALAVQRRPI